MVRGGDEVWGRGFWRGDHTGKLPNTWHTWTCNCKEKINASRVWRSNYASGTGSFFHCLLPFLIDDSLTAAQVARSNTLLPCCPTDTTLTQHTYIHNIASFPSSKKKKHSVFWFLNFYITRILSKNLVLDISSEILCR